MGVRGAATVVQVPVEALDAVLAFTQKAGGDILQTMTTGGIPPRTSRRTVVNQKNLTPFKVGDSAMLLLPDGTSQKCKVTRIMDEEGGAICVVAAGLGTQRIEVDEISERLQHC